MFDLVTLCRVIRIAPFANRLAMSVPPHIQFLRCLTNYKALRFSSPISTLAKKLVNQMIEKSSRTDGKYIAVHLRFEEVLMLILSYWELIIGVNMCVFVSEGCKNDSALCIDLLNLLDMQDMVAFSCCVYDGGEAEKLEMDSVREKGWRGKFKRKDRIIVPKLNRVNGKCPLTPLEVFIYLFQCFSLSDLKFLFQCPDNPKEKI